VYIRVHVMSVVGKDVLPSEGLRVVITEDGRNWDINKMKRGDSSGGGAGSIVEAREGGKVFLLQLVGQRCHILIYIRRLKN